MYTPSGTATVHDAATRRYGRAWADATLVPGLTPLTPQAFVSGPAYTLRITPVDDSDERRRDTFFELLAQAPAGAVIAVEDASGGEGAVIGDVVLHALERAGVAGLITDGTMRDTRGYPEQAVGVWASGRAVSALDKSVVATEVNGPVTIRGVEIRPNETILADIDGVIALPSEAVDEIAPVAEQIDRASERMNEAIASGSGLSEARRLHSPHHR